MPQTPAQFSIVRALILIAIAALVVVSIPKAYRRAQTLIASGQCLAEMQAYASETQRALQRNETPRPPLDRKCMGSTDASGGVTQDTDLFAAPRPPGTGRIRCDLNVPALCEEI